MYHAGQNTVMLTEKGYIAKWNGLSIFSNALSSVRDVHNEIISKRTNYRTILQEVLQKLWHRLLIPPIYIPVVRGRLRKYYNFNEIIWKTCCCIAAEKQIYYSMHSIAKGSMYIQYRPWLGLTLLIWWLLCGPLLSHGVRLSHHWWRVGARGCTREGRYGKGVNDGKWNNDSDQKDWKCISSQIKLVQQTQVH